MASHTQQVTGVLRLVRPQARAASVTSRSCGVTTRSAGLKIYKDSGYAVIVVKVGEAHPAITVTDDHDRRLAATPYDVTVVQDLVNHLSSPTVLVDGGVTDEVASAVEGTIGSSVGDTVAIAVGPAQYTDSSLRVVSNVFPVQGDAMLFDDTCWDTGSASSSTAKVKTKAVAGITESETVNAHAVPISIVKKLAGAA